MSVVWSLSSGSRGTEAAPPREVNSMQDAAQLGEALQPVEFDPD